MVAGNAWPLKNDVWRFRVDGPTFLTQPVIEEFAGGEYRDHAGGFQSQCLAGAV